MESPRLWDQCLALPVHPAVTPPCESAVHAHPVLLSFLRPFLCFPASPCQTGKGKPGQWPGLSVFPFCAAVLPGRETTLQVWTAMQDMETAEPFLQAFSNRAQRPHSLWGAGKEATCISRSRALRHSEVSLSWVLQHTGAETSHESWHSPYCDSSLSAHGLTSERCKRRP